MKFPLSEQKRCWAREAREAREARALELEERTEVEGEKGGVSADLGGALTAPWPLVRDLLVGSRRGGRKGRWGTSRTCRPGSAPGKRRVFRGDVCAEPGGGAGREWGVQQGRGFCCGELSRAFFRAAQLGHSELDGVVGMIVSVTDLEVPPG